MFKRIRTKLLTLGIAILLTTSAFSTITPSFATQISLPAVVPGGSAQLFNMHLERLAPHVNYEVACQYHILYRIESSNSPLDIYVDNNMPYPLFMGRNEVAPNTVLSLKQEPSTAVVHFSLAVGEKAKMETFKIINADSLLTSLYVGPCAAINKSHNPH